MTLEEDLAKWRESYTVTPSRYPRMNFGKHKGRPIDQLPSSYLRWLGSGALGAYFAALAKAAATNSDDIPDPRDFVVLSMSDDGEQIEIEAPYELLDVIRELPEKAFDREVKRWCVPFALLDAVIRHFPNAHVHITSDCHVNAHCMRREFENVRSHRLYILKQATAKQMSLDKFI